MRSPDYPTHSTFESMTKYNIGIDTGGTYTDAVIIDILRQKVTATAKSLTTKGKLEIGVANALEAVMQASGSKIDASQIALVALSTTLATNALVEGMGSSVAAVLVGFSDDMLLRSNLKQAIPSAQIVRVSGGHEYDGSESTLLDENNLRQQILSIEGSVEAFSVSSNYSIRNPQHEQRAREIIQEITAKPVTLSSDLSDGLNGPLRALTATFNVRIVSLIIDLLESVRNAMKQHSIDAPLMIVKGDGSITTAESIIDRPIDTILSGPAASVIGANFISGLDDFIISDVGGTTTDVAIVSNGWPKLNEKGAIAGGYRTMVRAIDMQTIGLGGDSEVSIDHKGLVSLKSNRVVPISLLCEKFPDVLQQLDSSLGNGMGLARAIRYIFIAQGFASKKFPPGLSDQDLEFLQKIGDRPRSFDEFVVRASDRARAERLLDRGIVQVSGLTPSDAAHVLNLQSQWNLAAARLGCLMLGRSFGLISWNKDNTEQGIVDFASRIFDTMVAKSTGLIINQLTGVEFDANNPLINAVTRGEQNLNQLSVVFKPNIPIVAVGGPAQVFYKAVGERLNCKSEIPQNAQVANAIGAAIGRIRIRKVIEITSGEGGGYHIHYAHSPLFQLNSNDALEQAQQLAHDYVRDKVVAMGGVSPEVEVNVERIDLPNMNSDNSLIGATVIAECFSSPAI